MPLAHVGEQVQRAAAHWHVQRLADQSGDARRMVGAGRQNVEHILDVDHADDRIQLPAIDRQAAVPRLREDLYQMREGRIFLDRDDVGTRHANIARVALAEMQQVAHHLPFQRRQVALGVGAGIVLMPVDRLFQLVAERFLLAAAEDQRAQPAPDTRFVGVAVTGATSVLCHGSLCQSSRTR
ncbi:hypothetical protein WR25_14119 [Diploscapter pachys]|uniref:Uncharacterized protein n=1 Tax=Diploscapter pachys TaxID=2018661 RepID=A0A2A2KLN5_9BILA|nr:hypothetical protein WR25_14119 [Diploscapter pachys]